MFDCGKPKHVATFEKSLKRITDYIHREGDKGECSGGRWPKNLYDAYHTVPPMLPQIEDPNNLGVLIEDRGVMIMWEGELRHLPTGRNDLRNGLVHSYTLLWNQCTPLMKSKLEQQPGFPTFNPAKDPITLIAEMRNIVSGREGHMQDAWSLCKLFKFMPGEWQKEAETNEEWMECFHGMWEAVKQHGGSLWSHPLLIQDRAQEIAGAVNIPTAAQLQQAEQAVENKMKTMFILTMANKAKHDDLRTHLQNSYMVGCDEYPMNTPELLSVMNNWKPKEAAQGHYSYMQIRASEDDGLNFAQEGDSGVQVNKAEGEKKGISMIQSRKGRPKSMMKASFYRDPTGESPKPASEDNIQQSPCIHCAGPHGLKACTDITNEQLGKLLVQLGGSSKGQMIFQDDKARGSSLNRNYLYLDTCSTEDQRVVPQYLNGVHTINDPLTLYTNAGKSQTNKKGYLGENRFLARREGYSQCYLTQNAGTNIPHHLQQQEAGGSIRLSHSQGYCSV